MKPSRPYTDEAITDEEARPEKAPRLSATQDSPTPPETKPYQTKSSHMIPTQTMQPAKITSSEAEPQDEPQVSGDSKANTATAPNLTSSNAALNIEESSTNDSKTSRITARVPQLKALLREEGDQFEAHITGLDDLEEFEEAMELLHLDKQRLDLSAGYPQTRDGFVAHCNELFDAMKNLINILDIVGVPGGNGQSSLTRSGDSIAVKFVKSKKPIEINLVAGKLMVSIDSTTESRHSLAISAANMNLQRAMLKAQRGRLSLPGRKFHEYDSFTLRFRAVVDALMVSHYCFTTHPSNPQRRACD